MVNDRLTDTLGGWFMVAAAGFIGVSMLHTCSTHNRRIQEGFKQVLGEIQYTIDEHTTLKQVPQEKSLPTPLDISKPWYSNLPHHIVGDSIVYELNNRIYLGETASRYSGSQVCSHVDIKDGLLFHSQKYDAVWVDSGWFVHGVKDGDEHKWKYPIDSQFEFQPESMTLTDLDNDGLEELVFDNRIRLTFDGWTRSYTTIDALTLDTMERSTHYIVGRGKKINSILAYDFDEDGDNDIAYLRDSISKVYALENELIPSESFSVSLKNIEQEMDLTPLYILLLYSATL